MRRSAFADFAPTRGGRTRPDARPLDRAPLTRLGCCSLKAGPHTVDIARIEAPP